MHSSINADQLLRGLALAVARNEVGAQRPIDEVIAGEGLTRTEFANISANPMYKRYVESYVTDLKENGYSFAAKSKVLAEDLLPVAYHMARDDDVPAAVRAKLIENLVEWADLKPKRNVEATSGPSYGISIVINGTTATTVSAQPHTIEAIPSEAIINLPAAPEKAPSAIVFDEPDSYEYAGEDHYL